MAKRPDTDKILLKGHHYIKKPRIFEAVKRIVVIFCLLCYVASSVSLSIYLNYCNDKLSRVALSGEPEPDGCCDDDANGDCCNSEVISINKTDDHRINAPYSLVVNPADALVSTPCFFPIAAYLLPVNNSIAGPVLHPPPLITGDLNLHILHSVFLV